jgi:hypothetical protein
MFFIGNMVRPPSEEVCGISWTYYTLYTHRLGKKGASVPNEESQVLEAIKNRKAHFLSIQHFHYIFGKLR